MKDHIERKLVNIDFEHQCGPQKKLLGLHNFNYKTVVKYENNAYIKTLIYIK